MCARRTNIVFFYRIGQKKVTLGPLFSSKNDENRACVTKNMFNTSRDKINSDTSARIILLSHWYQKVLLDYLNIIFKYHKITR